VNDRSAGVSPAWPHTGASRRPALPAGPQAPPMHGPSCELWGGWAQTRPRTIRQGNGVAMVQCGVVVSGSSCMAGRVGALS
jgi:hypothetical protein